MRKNKIKIIMAVAIFAVGIFCVQSFINAQSGTNPLMDLGDGSGIQGGSVTLDLTVSNNSAATSFVGFIKYNPTVLSIPDPIDSAITSSVGKIIESSLISQTASENTLKFVIYGAKTVIPNGKVGTITFNISPSDTSGAKVVAMEFDSAATSSEPPVSVTFDVSGGTVTVSGPTIVYDSADFSRLLARWLQSPVTPPDGEPTVDIDGNGIVNTKDLGMMMHNWGSN